MRWVVRPGSIGGSAAMPGDKSIAHRSLMLAALAGGRSRIQDLPNGADVAATTACLQALGIAVERQNGQMTVQPAALRHGQTLDAANSGTTMRLLAGLLAGQGVTAILSGDSSLRRRPMARVVDPLTLMGAHIDSAGGKPPLQLHGGPVHGIAYRLPVASAQVKSAVLLAGLGAEGETIVEEPLPTRDHTERMLTALGVPIHRASGRIAVRAGCPRAFDVTVPGDISSAAFLLVAAAAQGSSVTIRGVGLNPTRTDLLTVLRDLGCSLEAVHHAEQLGEPVGDVTLSGRADKSLTIESRQVPGLIDELPLLAFLATQLPGTSVISGAEELRVKESDRIQSVAETLTALGADIEERPDGFVVHGRTKLRGAVVDSHGDHRIAMMLAIAGTLAAGETVIENADAAGVSFPEFDSILRDLDGRIDRD